MASSLKTEIKGTRTTGLKAAELDSVRGNRADGGETQLLQAVKCAGEMENENDYDGEIRTAA
jgi:hypothetical protein